MLAYLVIREGSKWTDVFRLIPGQVGHHRPCADQPDRDQGRALQPLPCRGLPVARRLDLARLGKPQRHADRIAKWFAATTRCSRATSSASASRNWSSSTTCPRRFPIRATCCGRGPIADETVAKMILPDEFDDDDNVLAEQEPATITHRRGQTKFLEPHEEATRRQGDSASSAAPRPRFAGWRSSWPRRPTSAPWPTLALTGLFERNAGRCRRAAAACRATCRAKPTVDDLEIVAVAHRFRIALSSRLELSGRHRAPRRRGGAGPQRHGRQHAGQPRQQGRNARHQRDLRAGPPRQAVDRPGASLFDRSGARARPRRSGIHAGRGRHRGRGARKSQPAAGTGRKPDPRPRRKPATPRTAGRAKRNRRLQRADGPRHPGNRPGRAQPGHGADSRRERRGQGTGRPRGPLFQPAAQGAVRLPELRRLVAEPAGQRAVRPRAGSVHRRHAAQDRQVRGRRTRAR